MNLYQCILVWALTKTGRVKINCTPQDYTTCFLVTNATHKQTKMRLFEFWTFYYSFLFFNGFHFKGSCSSKSILFIYCYFLQRKILYNLFYFSQNNIRRYIIYTHIIVFIPYIMMIIYFQCQAPEITHDQCVNFRSYIFGQFEPVGAFNRFLLLQWVNITFNLLRIFF